jgi:carotenoid cleavage dioxygenase-like enzyme
MGAMTGWGTLHRREFLALAGGAVLAACGGGSSSGDGTTTLLPPGTTAPFDPELAWWLQRGYAPVTDEVEAFDLEVVGAIPPELVGLYVRNGSNPASGTSSHWFFGDGMVHGVRLDGGRAESYRNRYVRTALYESGAGFGEGPPGGASNQSNVSALTHAGKLLTSGEVGLPFELSADDLSTIGVHDYGGRLTTAFTAHPKLDPATGHLHFFGYGFVPPYLTYHVADATGALVHSTEVPVPAPTMIHDFAITEHDVVFWDLPVVFDIDLAIRMVAGEAGAFPFVWRPDNGSRVGVLPLGGDGSEVVWSDLDEPCYAFHGVNAFRDGEGADGEVVVDICRLSSMFDDGEVLGGTSTLRRWRVPVGGGTVADEVLVDADGDPGDLPSRDERRVGRDHRYGYLVSGRPAEGTVDLGGVIKHDFRTGERTAWDPGPSRHSGEWLFVPDPDAAVDGSAADDEGWLLCYVHDEATEATDLVILDATDVAAGPVASIRTPQRVPYGFHGTFVRT